MEKFEITINKETIYLSKKEYVTFELLLSKKGQVVSKEEIFTCLQTEFDEKPEIKIVGVIISKLIKKVNQAGKGKQCIRTVWQKGYQLISK